jgi:hypothetical protein
MNYQARIASILKAYPLGESITGLPTFSLSALKLASNMEFRLPTNLRLGHLVERIVAELIKSSTNYKVLYKNIQLLEGKITIGELDFLIEEIDTKQIIHMELAYKFYLFDPSISPEPINNWIGPNRNDSLIEKLGKLKAKQFPLLYDEISQVQLPHLNLEEVKQQLCLLVSLFIPYQHKGSFDPGYAKAIKGYYLNWEQFECIHHSGISYYIPTKKEWGIAAFENNRWFDFDEVKEQIQKSLEEKQCPLIWQKKEGIYSAFFVTWW